jgi:LCP family protein required for cell wall assembly
MGHVFGRSTLVRSPGPALGVVLVATLVAASCTGGDPAGDAGRPTPPPAASSQEPPAVSPAPSFSLALELRDVSAHGAEGRIPRSALGESAEDVRAAMSEFYSIAFVDPDGWAGGEFTPLFRLFASDVREIAHSDLTDLTLGEAVRTVESVRPMRGEIDVRFLADASERPVAAITRVVFSGIARVGESRGTVSHGGEYVLRRLQGGWRIVGYDVRGRIPALGDASGGPVAARLDPGVPADDVLFILVIGSDARPGQPVTRTRADSLHVVGLNRREAKVSILGIPRDSWVPIPGAGSDKINAALARGGPGLLVQTVERLSGIGIDAYFLTGFEGFKDAVAAVRGIDINVPFPISDRYAHAQFRKGPTHLTAKEALAFARARHDLPNGDFGRSLNQGRLMIAALATLRDQIARGRGMLVRWAVAGAVNLRTDLSLEEMFDLLAAAPSIRPARVRNQVVSGRVGNIGGRSVVLLDGGAYAMFRDLSRDGVLGG